MDMSVRVIGKTRVRIPLGSPVPSPWKISFNKGSTACHSRPPSNNGDSGLGCILPLFEVIMADLAGPAVTWDTCSNSLRQIEPTSKVHLQWVYILQF